MDPFGTFKVYTGAGADGKWFTADDVVGDPATLEGERVLQGLPWYGSTGLYHLRNRWYSPSLQRFLSLDPLGFDAGDANLYRFEGNDPLGNLDPMGAAVTLRNAGIAFGRGVLWGVGTRMMMSVAPRLMASMGPIGVAGGVLAFAYVAQTSAEIYTGMESGTMRKLCPQEIDARKDALLLFGIELGGSAGGYRAGNFLEGILPKSNSVNAGSGILEGEAESGLAPRAGEDAAPPTVGNTSGTSGSGNVKGTRTKNRLPEGKNGDLGPRDGKLEKRNPQTNELQQVRKYDCNGQPCKDIDFGHDHGKGDPHVHDWTRQSPMQPNPSRQDGRAPLPGELDDF